MIGYLHGKIIDLTDQSILVLTENIGYEVYFGTHPKSFCQIGEMISLYTYLHVRDDGIQLYGFRRKQDKDIFLKLRTVSGIGAKTAIAMISASDSEKLISDIINKNETGLMKLPGCGKKTAQRIIFELEEKLGEFESLSSVASSSNDRIKNNDTADLEAALANLGYSSSEINTTLAQLIINEQKSDETLLKEALTILMKR